ncbi:signal transduction histidine kinase/ligand-binding sensor domain-containing protein/DNA-binding response OmpR family regulator [Algoriphagus sp. 4150]|uniref:hybrid sensor histidine kinase/response regulator transcription factor n=1 Tax=Algoriphagus sp. 4150 TaxID=2817756 RepID=UPI0028630A24|nr:two-component regulator propeller domain-containing protein [Algoriphagus sp. 4150]MDR7132007.1 signal transduction histidine kinase/ligand-binding sensor domain-containing protein/DNA-binding response OmpR family regulator [Algoriphagus sp. 4150]
MKWLVPVLSVLILVHFFSIRAVGQRHYQFQHLTTKEGLSNSNVSAVLKDSYGFLWIGMEYGLNRYDGYGFKSYSAELGASNNRLLNNVMGLQEDGLGNIWISSFSYLVYNRSKDNFITDVPEFLRELGILVDGDFHVYVDKKKDIWVLDKQKMHHYNTRTETVSVINLNVQLEEMASVRLSDDGEYLYGVLRPGMLWQMHKHSGNQQLHRLDDIEQPEQYNKVYADSRSGLWLFSGKSGLIYYRKNPKAGWEKLLMSSNGKGTSNRVLDILDDESGHVWIGTDHNGLFIYDRAGGNLTNLLEDYGNKTSISSNNVVHIYRDDSGIMWIAHNKKGISYYHDSFNSIISADHPECRDVSAILEDRNGNIWLGTDGNGLLLKENTVDGKIRKLPVGNSTAIVSLLEDSKGRVWIGTYLEGLICYENGRFSQYTTRNSGLASNNIWDLAEDRYGNVWIGTLEGGIQYIRKDIVGLDSLETVCEWMKHPLDMYYDGGDKLYVGTVYGLYVVDIISGSCSILVGNSQGTQNFNQMIISNVYKAENGNILLGHPRGVTLWDVKKDTLYFIDENSGLADNNVRGIIEDDNHNIWVTTSNGLSVLSTERDSQDYLRISSRNFSTKDGFNNNYFNNRSIYKLRNRDILVGGTEGFTIVNPNKIVEKKQPLAKVSFTGLSVGNSSVKVDSLYNGHKLLMRPMEQTDSLTFRHNDRMIALQFTTGDLLYADKVRYSYRLEGFSQEWITIQENKVMFSSLAPGSYKLYVKASNSDGVWNDVPTVLSITVTPPFYLSSWAIALYIVFAISLISYVIYRTRNHQRTRLEQQKIHLEREQEVNLNEMKLKFFTNVSHDLRTPLTLITTPLQAILEGDLEDGFRQKLNIINKNAGQLLRLINSLLDFRKLDAKAESLNLRQGDFIGFIRNICLPFYNYAIDRQMSFVFTCETECLLMEFDPAKVQKIMLNLLSNAFKFTQSGEAVEVHVCGQDDFVFVNVSDSGQGVADKDKAYIFERFYQASQAHDNLGSGIGLHIVSEYVHMHGGIIEVKDNEPRGSIFTFRLPIIETGEVEGLEPEDESSDGFAEDIDEQVFPSKPVLLFVDDNLDLCEFMAGSLSDEFTVILANNGKQAIEQLEVNDVRVVVSDVMMPVMSGIELCHQIKTNIHWSHIPVILLTARTAEEYQIEGLEMGADDYLTKPFNFNLLKLRIRKFLEWTELSHITFSQKMDVSPSEITITSLDQKLIEKAIKVVEEHISEPEFSVEDLGSEVGLSRSHLYKKLMNITGKGPAEFIRTIRLKRGRQLLEQNQMQIAEVAYSVGFNSPKRFTINFKNEFGILPSDYVRSIK